MERLTFERFCEFEQLNYSPIDLFIPKDGDNYSKLDFRFRYFPQFIIDDGVGKLEGKWQPWILVHTLDSLTTEFRVPREFLDACILNQTHFDIPVWLFFSSGDNYPLFLPIDVFSQECKHEGDHVVFNTNCFKEVKK